MTVEPTSFEEVSKLFSTLWDDNGNNTDEEVGLLENLLKEYSYCHSLHIIYAALLKDEEAKFNDYIPTAAVSVPQRDVLYKAIHSPGVLVNDNSFTTIFPSTEVEHDDVLVEELETVEPSEIIETHSSPYIETVIPDSERPDWVEEKEANIPEGKPAEEAVFIEDEGIEDEPNFTDHSDIAIEEIEKEEADTTELFTEEIPEEVKSEHTVSQDKEENIFDSIAGTDYFIFDKSVVDPLQRVSDSEEVEIAENTHTEKSLPSSEIENHDISRYDDDKMPFTFLWWLQKTRTEHAENHQPYAPAKLPFSPSVAHSPEQLNHQIIENIFSHQVPLQEVDSFLPEASVPEVIEEDLIEKFIKDEPQIRPPRLEKLDTENKARKSSEDNFDLVSETLAQIYIEQMLYHKAIDTYKKLSLKYPEKSTYFAGQIKELEKKIS